jgi:hypothetical protein
MSGVPPVRLDIGLLGEFPDDEGKSKPIIIRPTPLQTDWQALIRQTRNHRELNAAQVAAVQQGLGVLQSELGDEVLELRHDTMHPLVWWVSNYAGWSRLWLTWLAQAILDMKSTPGFESLARKLRTSAGYEEAVSVLAVGWRLKSNDFRVGMEPTVLVDGRLKKPDLYAESAECDKSIIVEVSALAQSDALRQGMDTCQQLSDTAFMSAPGIVFAGRAHRPLAPRHLGDVLESLKAVVLKCVETGTMQMLDLRGEVEVAVAPAELRSHLAEWATTRGLRPGLIAAPSGESKEVNRIRHKISRKSDQLPTGHPSIIVVPCEMEHRDVDTLSRLLFDALECAYEHPKVSCVVLSSQCLGGGPGHDLINGENICTRRVGISPLVEQHAVLFNRYADTPLPPSVRTRLRKAFTTTCSPRIPW